MFCLIFDVIIKRSNGNGLTGFFEISESALKEFLNEKMIFGYWIFAHKK